MNWTAEPFESERLVYREITMEDAPTLVKWRSDPEIIQYYSNPEPVTYEAHRKWFEENYQSDTTRVDYLVQIKETFRPIGFVGVNNLCWGKKETFINYTIGERDCWGKGYATEAIRALLNRYHGASIKYFNARVHRGNASSLKTIEKLDFAPYVQDDVFILLQKIM